MLGQHTEQDKSMCKIKKSLSYKHINLQNLATILQDMEPPVIPAAVTCVEQLSGIVETGCSVIVDSAAKCKKFDASQPQWDQTRPRWAQILDSQDMKTIWRSLNWRGTFDHPDDSQPSDSAFKNHFEFRKRIFARFDHFANVFFCANPPCFS